MTKSDQAALILEAIGQEWSTYYQIHNHIKNNGTKISIGGISNIIWRNTDSIQDKIEWENEVFGSKHYQSRMKFRRKTNTDC